jgi:hypothetical protein
MSNNYLGQNIEYPLQDFRKSIFEGGHTMFFLPVMTMPEPDGNHGDGPGDPDGTRRRIRAHVLISAAFGLAMAFTGLLFFLVFHYWVEIPPGPLAVFFSTLVPNGFRAFLYGLVFGTFIAFVYNGLVAHHFNVFNIDAEDYA